MDMTAVSQSYRHRQQSLAQPHFKPRKLLQTGLSQSGTAVMNSGEGHQRSFSVRPSERQLHLQDRVLGSG